MDQVQEQAPVYLALDSKLDLYTAAAEKQSLRWGFLFIWLIEHTI